MKSKKLDIKIRLLLACGILSSLFYVFMNIICAALYKGYSSISYTVSELSAIGAPTRTLWVSLAIVYSILLIAFGIGLYKYSNKNRSLKIAGILFIIYNIFGLFWPPMHQREVLAAGGGSLSDTLHLVFTSLTVLFMFAVILLSSNSLGKRFRYYSISTIAIMLISGAITSTYASRIQANLPTPFVGIWERISIAAFIIWVIILGYGLLKKK